VQQSVKWKVKPRLRSGVVVICWLVWSGLPGTWQLVVTVHGLTQKTLSILNKLFPRAKIINKRNVDHKQKIKKQEIEK
jgi:hypothetical protein